MVGPCPPSVLASPTVPRGRGVDLMTHYPPGSMSQDTEAGDPRTAPAGAEAKATLTRSGSMQA